MDFATVLAILKGNVNVLTVVVLVLFIASEVLGSNERIKANSVYNILKSMLMTVIDQIKPAPKVLAAPAPVEASQSPKV